MAGKKKQELRIFEQGGNVRVTLERDLVSSNAEEIRAVLTDGLGSATKVLVLDVFAVEEVDADGVKLITGLIASCRRRNVQLVIETAREGVAAKLLRQLGIDRVVDVREAS